MQATKGNNKKAQKKLQANKLQAKEFQEFQGAYVRTRHELDFLATTASTFGECHVVR